MAILTKSGRSAIAQSIKNQQIHLAWGEGPESWEKTAESVESPLSDNLSEDILATGLVKEIGRRLADEVLFVEGCQAPKIRSSFKLANLLIGGK